MSEKIHTTVTSKEHFLFNSERITVEPNRKYRFYSQITAQKGKKYAAYIAIIVLNSRVQEISRYIRWITDFSGKPKEYSILFPTVEQ